MNGYRDDERRRGYHPDDNRWRSDRDQGREPWGGGDRGGWRGQGGDWDRERGQRGRSGAGSWGREQDWEMGRGNRSRSEHRGDDGRRSSGMSDRYRQPERLGDRNRRDERDDPDYGQPRYGGGDTSGYGSGFGPSSDPNSFFGAPGFDAEFGGPRFDRQDVGSTGTHGVHPVSSVYGADYRGAIGAAGGGYGAGMAGSSARRYAEMQRHRDPHYDQWRRRHAEELDNDYEEFRREQQQRFHSEFGSWRERRGQQRQALGRVTEHMEVIGSDGSHVGTVDKVRGDRIILTRSDPDAGGMHHSVPCGWVDRVEDKVHLNLGAEDAKNRWRDEEENRAMFSGEERGRFSRADRDQRDRRYASEGPHMLNRSFAGTYPEEDRGRRDRERDR